MFMLEHIIEHINPFQYIPQVINYMKFYAILVLKIQQG